MHRLHTSTTPVKGSATNKSKAPVVELATNRLYQLPTLHIAEAHLRNLTPAGSPGRAGHKHIDDVLPAHGRPPDHAGAQGKGRQGEHLLSPGEDDGLGLLLLGRLVVEATRLLTPGVLQHTK